MKINKKIGILTLSAIGIISCVDDKDLALNNPNQISPENFVITNSAELLAFSTASYGDLQLRGTYARHAFFIHDGMSDECDAVKMEIDKQQMHDYTIDAANIGITRYWIACYQGIGKANNVISILNSSINPQSDSLTEKEINQALGENYFTRALYYFMLTTRFGGVPMPLVPATNTNGTAKTSQENVYNQILLDLDEAIKSCQTKNELGSNNYGRATKGAAYALKGKVHLYLKQYSEAVNAFENVENDPSNYTIQGVEFADNFGEENEHNAESIFEVNFSSDFPVDGTGNGWSTSGKGNAETTFRAIEYANFGNLPVGTELTKAFEDGDPRTKITIRDNGRWNKYSYPVENAGNSGINVRVIRMADVLLMKAEALNEIDFDTNKNDILALMNKVRDRVGMPNYGSNEMNVKFPVNNKAKTLEAIQHERRVELAGEQVRLNDMLRWNIAKEMIEKNKPSVTFVKGKHELLPIPTLEIDNNPLISGTDQNNGY